MSARPAVSLIVLADRPWSLRVLLAALEVQTEPAWEALILDQGDPDDAGVQSVVRSRRMPPAPTWDPDEADAAVYRARIAEYMTQVRALAGAPRDARVCYERVPRHGDWGQTEKIAAVSRVRGEWVGFPNDDAYYCPRYVELMLAAAVNASADLVYCDWVSAKDFGTPYEVYEVAPVTGYIDVGGFLVRREVLLAHGWSDRGPTGDGHLIESLVASGIRHVRVPHVLYVKN